jgi:glycerol-3-phosphate cytidylyltransferase
MINIIGFTCSTFDLLHTGHILMLEEAKSQCDYLICGLQIDPSVDRPEKNSPIQSYYERFIQLSAVKYVDKIIPYTTEEELLTILQTNDIDVRILGDEYETKQFTGNYLDMDYYFNKRTHNYSTSELRRRTAVKEIHIEDIFNDEKKEKLKEFIKEYNDGK